MSYRVTMLDPKGKTLTEIISAESEAQLVALIKQRGNYCLNYEEVDDISKTRGKLRIKALVVFCYQVSAMLSAGINLIDSLRMIQGKAQSTRERKIYRNLYEEVQKGNSLSAAMIAQEGAFDDLLISMVKSGEASGALDEALITMSRQYERDHKVNQKLRTASIYPLVLFVLSVVVVLLLVVFVLPGITSSFDQETMPFVTKVLLGVANFVISYWYILLMILFAIIGGFIIMLNNHKTRVALHRQFLYLPIIGNLIRTVYSARCARSFASLYGHGVSTLEMIDLTGKVLGNAYLEEEFKKIYINVSRGELISRSIAEIEEFDSMLSSMISVGEETGSLDSILERTADYFDEESQSATTRMVGLIEPVMIISLGLMIGLIVISIIQPIFKMYETLG